MAEYIPREAARKILCGWCRERELCDGSCLAEKELDAIPAADVVPVVHGKWAQTGCYHGIKVCECSACKKRAYGSTKFSSNCGARMDGGCTRIEFVDSDDYRGVIICGGNGMDGDGE